MRNEQRGMWDLGWQEALREQSIGENCFLRPVRELGQEAGAVVKQGWGCHSEIYTKGDAGVGKPTLPTSLPPDHASASHLPNPARSHAQPLGTSKPEWTRVGANEE